MGNLDSKFAILTGIVAKRQARSVDCRFPENDSLTSRRQVRGLGESTRASPGDRKVNANLSGQHPVRRQTWKRAYANREHLQ
jgi:hypothetical protein